MNDPRAPQWVLDGAGTPGRFTLYDAAHARTGDKGDLCNIALIAWSLELYPLLLEQVTPDVVAAHFGHRPLRAVRRYPLPGLHAMNFVLEGALDGGVNDALNLDAHGKSFAFFLLTLPIAVPAPLHELLRKPAVRAFPSPQPQPHARSLP